MAALQALMKLVVIFLSLGAATPEVGDNFNNCHNFFYQSTPPVISYPEEFDGKSICQVYNNAYHYATFYSKRWRIPIYSAYRLQLESCRGNQPPRRDQWFIEPQVGSFERIYYVVIREARW